MQLETTGAAAGLLSTRVSEADAEGMHDLKGHQVYHPQLWQIDLSCAAERLHKLTCCMTKRQAGTSIGQEVFRMWRICRAASCEMGTLLSADARLQSPGRASCKWTGDAAAHAQISSA